VKACVLELYVVLQSMVVDVAGGAWPAGAKLLGVYPNTGVAHAAGMPGAASVQLKPSAAPVPVQLDPHDRSLRPEAFRHLPPPHWASVVQ